MPKEKEFDSESFDTYEEAKAFAETLCDCSVLAACKDPDTGDYFFVDANPEKHYTEGNSVMYYAVVENFE